MGVVWKCKSSDELRSRFDCQPAPEKCSLTKPVCLFPLVFLLTSDSVVVLCVRRDASRVKQLEEKLSAARQLLAQQKAQELSVQREHKKADTHKKMTEF